MWSDSDDSEGGLPGTKKPPLGGTSSLGGVSQGVAPSSTGSGSGATTSNYASGLLSGIGGPRRRGAPPSRTSSGGGGSRNASPTTVLTPTNRNPPRAKSPRSNLEGVLDRPRSRSPVSGSPPKDTPTEHAPPAATPPAPAPVPVPAPVEQKPPEPQGPTAEERIKALQQQIEEKRAALVRSKEDEKKLLDTQAERKKEFDDTFQRLDKEVRDLRRDAEEDRGRITTEIMNAEQDHEKFLRVERQRIEESISRESEPELQSLRDELKDLRDKKSKLSHGITTSSANRDVVNAAISAAMYSIVERLRGDFEENVLNDESWEEKVRSLVRTEVGDSVTKALHGDEAAEKKEQSKAFGSMLEFWRQAEDEERAHILKMDEQLLLDLNTMAGDDLDRMHREELTMQQVYMEGREAWAKHHRATMNDELEAAIRRRDNEFSDIRKERGDLHQLKLKQIEEAHRTMMERLSEMHEKETKATRDEYSAKQLLREERSKAHLEAQEKASEAVASLEDAAKDFEKLLARVDDYRATLDKTKDDVQSQKMAQLAEQEEALTEIQELITSQSSAMDAERRSLAGTVVKLEVVDSALNKQMEEERTWLGQLLNKLERSKADWEREYRRWQHLTQQEQQAVEQRFSSILLDLRAAGSSLEEESKELDLEAASLKKRCEDRANKAAHEMAGIQAKEDAVQERYGAMLAVANDLEVKGANLAGEWEALHDDRQKLSFRRQDLAKEKVKMDHLSLQLQDMRRSVDTANHDSTTMAERAKTLQRQIQSSQAVVDYDGKALREQGVRLTKERDRLTTEQSRLNDLATRQHMRYANAARKTTGHNNGGDRLPNRMMAELQEVLAGPGGNAGKQQHADPHQYQGPRHQQDISSIMLHQQRGGQASVLSPSNRSAFGGNTTVVPLDPSLPPSQAGGDVTDSSFTPLEDNMSKSESSMQAGAHH